jgi:hypothetical protein
MEEIRPGQVRACRWRGPGERHRGGGPARPAALASLRAGVRHEGYTDLTLVNHKGSGPPLIFERRGTASKLNGQADREQGSSLLVALAAAHSVSLPLDLLV